MNMNDKLDQLRSKKGFICDMDGVIYHATSLLNGVPEFVGLASEGKQEASCS